MDGRRTEPKPQPTVGPVKRVELPRDLQKEMEAVRKRVEEEKERADQILLKAFKTEIEMLKVPQFGMTDEERRRLLAELQRENHLFGSAGRIPFSPRMGRAVQQYVQAQSGVANRLTSVYGKAIDHFRTAGDAAGAQRIREAMPKALNRRVVGVFACTGAGPRNGTRLVLYSDGTTDSAGEGWKLEGGQLVLGAVIPGKAPTAPRDRCVLEPDGLSFTGTGPAGENWKGTRVDPPN
jgi:hypothetical protein